MSAHEIANLRAQIAALTTTLTETKERMNSLETNATVTVTDQYQDCAPNITDESQINLEIFKMLPIFIGDTNQYRSWRKRAWTHMENIKNYATTPTYYTALSIVHSKIQGEAADILINHNTKFNFYSIINRLDYTYADQRPLYVLLEAMKRVKQGKRTLAEFHSEISKSLNLALTKVEMDSSGNPSAMKEYANQEAVRTFILGLNSKYTSGTLYSHSPKDLETAYAIASTIHHDNVNLQFDFPQYNHRHYNASPGRRHEEPQGYRPNVQVQYNQTAPRQEHQPMEIDSSQKYTRSANYNRNHPAPQNSYDRQRQGLPPNNPFRGEPQKRERNPSSRNFNIQQKVQRVNQTRDEEIQSLAPENDEYETGSVFLRRMNDLPCLQRHCKDTGKLINILIDTGATNNYISKKCKIGKPIPIKPVKVKTLHGYSITKSKKIVTLLEHNLTFFETDALEEFDMLLGEQGLRKIKAEINLFEYKLSYKYRVKKESESVQKINYTVNSEKYRPEIEEYGAKLVYKPGHQNVVADALSRQQINNTVNSDDSQHSAQSSPTQKLKRVKQPLNTFRNQIIVRQSDQNSIELSSKNIFSNSRHTIFFNTKTELLDRLKNIIRPKVTNALKIDEEILFHVENDIIDTFPTVSIVLAQKLVDDITETEQQEQIIQDTHRRAHRNYKNNAQEISLKYYWPNIRDACKKEVQDCEICLTNKYERRPNKQPIGSAPVPNKVGEYIHLDLFFMSNNMYISSTDKYSKFCHLRQIPSKKDTYKYVDEILSQIYPNAKFVMTDNESTFTGICAQQIYKRLQITHTKTPAYHSTTNGQVERTHSTIIELAKVLAHQHSSAPDEQIFEAIRQYNKTIHSVTNEKPEDVFFNQRRYPDIKERLQQNQERVLRYHNRNRKQLNYKEGDIIYSKTHRRNKNVKKYARHIVKKDNGETVTTNKRVIIHKDNIRVKACTE